MSPRSRRLSLVSVLSLCGALAIGPAATSSASPVPALASQPRLEGYLPAGVTYDPTLPKPASVLGFEVGEWHVRHDQLLRYLEELAKASDRVQLEVQGRTHEGRSQILLTLSSPENLGRLEDIRRRHLQRCDPRQPLPDDEGLDDPVVVLLGYSIHGNEASGSNAALVVAYHLAAAQGEAIESLLRHTVILLDPSLNPDGLARFAEWANMHRGRVPVADPYHREHRELWPNGRSNHYWFDLNRDWLPVQQPESQHRVETFQRWRPNVLADFHEMGSGATYFFQPGIPSRRNPLTPERNAELTAEIARYHAQALDRQGRLYFTEEAFDDFYYGKGSTYPDVQGSVGILFEQASARGLVQSTDQGLLTFPFAIQNQVTTSLSTLRAAADKGRELLDYQRQFFVDALREGRESSVRAYVFGDGSDPARTWHLLHILLAHQVEVRALGAPVEAQGQTFRPGEAFFVPLEQPQHRLVRTLFETQSEFADNTFYDISTWTLPLAFAMPYAALGRSQLGGATVGALIEGDAPPPAAASVPDEEAYAYLLSWSSYYAPRALYRLLSQQVQVRVATRPFALDTPQGPKSFPYGTLVVPIGLQSQSTRSALPEILRRIASEDGVEISTAAGGLTPSGVDLGSSSLRPLPTPVPLIAVGEGTSPYEAGELWHLLDQRMGMPVSLVDLDTLAGLDLAPYTHITLVQGSTRRLSEVVAKKLQRWTEEGGVLIATRGAALWAQETFLAGERGDESAAPAPTASTAPNESAPLQQPYAQFEQDRATQLVAGAVFEVTLDTTHPLAFGYSRDRLPVFRSGTYRLAPSGNPYENVALYTPSPRLSGYASSEQVEHLAGSAAVRAERLGRGAVILLADDPSFRAFWLGTDRLYLNALFFGSILKETSPPGSREARRATSP